jgi:hypothetical protein
MSRFIALTTTTGSPRLYSGASRTWLRVSSRVIDPAFLRGRNSARATAILRVPMPQNPPKTGVNALAAHADRRSCSYSSHRALAMRIKI